MPDLRALESALDELNADIAEQNRRLAEQNVVLDHQNTQLEAVNEKLSEFVPRRGFRRALLVIAIVILVALLVNWRVRVDDRRKARERVEQEYRSAVIDRENLIAGCNRANDQRATLRNIIERAYTPAPIPDGLSDELRELIEQSRERQAAQKEAQLREPGVQPIDCEKAYPPVNVES